MKTMEDFQLMSEKEKLKIINQRATVEQLRKFNNKFNPEISKMVFGEMMGPHLWEKFVVDARRDLLFWINSLSEDNSNLFHINLNGIIGGV